MSQRELIAERSLTTVGPLSVLLVIIVVGPPRTSGLLSADSQVGSGYKSVYRKSVTSFGEIVKLIGERGYKFNYSKIFQSRATASQTSPYSFFFTFASEYSFTVIL